MATWIRMRDPGTRHQFDVRKERVEQSLADGMEVVEGYPEHIGLNARPGKPYQELRAEAVARAKSEGSPIPDEFADAPDTETPPEKEPAAEPATPKKRSEKR